MSSDNDHISLFLINKGMYTFIQPLHRGQDVTQSSFKAESKWFE